MVTNNPTWVISNKQGKISLLERLFVRYFMQGKDSAFAHSDKALLVCQCELL